METEGQTRAGAGVPNGARGRRAQAVGAWRRALRRVRPRLTGAADEARALTAVTALGLLGGFALSHMLWLSSGRSFPAAPVFDFLPGVPRPFDLVWACALVASLVCVVASTRQRRYVFAFLAIAVPLALLDQTRWQPWFYQYLLMLAALSARAGREVEALRACGLIVAGTYFWGGAHKLNPQFFAEVVPSLAAELPASLARLVTPAAFLIPLVEICTGVMLLTRRWRRAGLVLALVTHASVLLLFFPARRNKVVWPWNAAMAGFVLLLFRRGAAGLKDFLPRRAASPQTMAVVLFGLMPALSFFGLWGHFLSGSVYSGETARARVRVSPEVARGLPPKVRPKLRADGAAAWLDLNHWSYVELKVPAYPSERTYRRAAARLCESAVRPADVLLVMTEAPRLFGGEPPVTALDCDALAPPSR
ncbi:MAG TPA: MauE/DoxX family redox-associated membrane protein [Pyrinomonadaceae bacterium]|jgi:hypothetical protein